MKQKKKPNAQQLCAAIRRHDVALLRSLLADGADPNAAVHDDCHGDIPVLLCAAGGQFLDGVEMLVNAGANPNAVMTGGQGAGGGQTALHSAISGGGEGPGSYLRHTEDSFLKNRLKIVDLLLKAGADPNVVDQGDRLPLYDAANNGDCGVCQRLIEAGATFKTWPTGCLPPLFGAAIGVAPHSAPEGHGQERVAKLLLDLGAPVDGEAENGMTALMAAAIPGSERLIKLFLDHGADVNHRSKDGRTPLICAALYAQDTFDDEEHQLALRIVKRLLDAGADPRPRNNKGESAYDIASRSEGPLAADFLKKSLSGKDK